MLEIRELLKSEQQHVAERLQQELSNPGCVILLGEQRMGKTSILQSLQDPRLSPHAYVALPGFGERQVNQAPPTMDEYFYCQILDGLRQGWRNNPPIYEPPRTDMNAWDRYDWFQAALQPFISRPITIMIDNADWLADCDWGSTFFRGFGSLMNSNNIRLVLAGTHSFARWAMSLRLAGRKAFLWEIAKLIPLNPLPSQIIKDKLIDYPELANRLIKLAGGHPYLLEQLTRTLNTREVSASRLIDDLEQEANWLKAECSNLFFDYWQTCDAPTRRLCFLLTAAPAGLDLPALSAKVTKGELDKALEILRRTGMVYQDGDGDPICLIELFRQWHQEEIGFIQNALKDPHLPPPDQLKVNGTPPITELTFFPDDDLVLIRRERYIYMSRLGINRRRIENTVTKTRKVPASDGKEFAKNIQILSQDLWQELKNFDWFQEIHRSAKDDFSLRFNIPVEMSEFPFELISLDEDGSERIGLEVPLSRQWVREGRYVERDPLTLPQAGQERLRVLVVGAEMGGDIWITPDGRIEETQRGDFFKLPRLNLDGEVAELRKIFVQHSNIFGEITFLTKSSQITNEKGNIVINKLPPTAETFRQVLERRDHQFDMLHFAGHGLFLPSNPAMGGLLFEDWLIHLDELADLLRSQQQLRFIYLSCCEGGALGADEQTSDLLGIAHACIQAGIPAVVAMRWRIPVIASQKLSSAFYPKFLEIGSLPQAMHTAIRRVYARERDPAQKVYSAAPVLIMH